MNLETLRSNLSANAKDIKLNLTTVLSEQGAPDLSQKQIFFIALASAYAVKNAEVIDAIREESEKYLSSQEIEATQSAAIIMAMNNIYYRFTHEVDDEAYANMPAKLRMNVMANPGIDRADFELCCMAVSAINGCGKCMRAHSVGLNRIGVSKLAVQSTVRIASVISALSLANMLSEV